MPQRPKRIRPGQWSFIDSRASWKGFKAEVESRADAGVSIVWPPDPQGPVCVKVNLEPSNGALHPVAFMLHKKDIQQLFLGTIEVMEVRGLLH